jgi:hypothetical protein
MNDACGRILRYFTAGLACLCFLQLAIWLPMYLTRPFFTDHDVFATMARNWDAGVMPYRDLASNNFPGSVYLFWCLGKVFGWGSVRWFYAFDVALLFTLVAMTTWWSRVRFGRFSPAIVGLLAVNSYYLNLDFSQAAQRDWHAPLLVVLGLMAAQTWPERGGRWLAALGFSAGFLVRPQVILFLPAMLLAVTEGPRLAGSSKFRTMMAATGWLAVVAILVFLGFLPLIRDHLLDDFLEGLRLVAYGGSYNNKSIGMVIKRLLEEIKSPRLLVVIASLALLAATAVARPARILAGTWLVALVGVFFYAPLSPNEPPYLWHPFWLTRSIGLAAVIGVFLGLEIPSNAKLLGFILTLGLVFGVPAWPRYSRPSHLRQTLVALSRGREVELAPSGYSHPYAKNPILPPWEDYQGVLEYLRTKTTPETKVANLLMGVAICGPAGSLSALPAESATWLYVVNQRDQAKFARALENCPDSVVVAWAPSEAIKPGPEAPDVGELIRFPMLDEVVHRLYRPAARFGPLEVWQRIPKE